MPKDFLAAPKMVSFCQLPAVKEDTIFGIARNFFGTSYLVTALATLLIITVKLLFE